MLPRDKTLRPRPLRQAHASALLTVLTATWLMTLAIAESSLHLTEVGTRVQRSDPFTETVQEAVDAPKRGRPALQAGRKMATTAAAFTLVCKTYSKCTDFNRWTSSSVGAQSSGRVMYNACNQLPTQMFTKSASGQIVGVSTDQPSGFQNFKQCLDYDITGGWSIGGNAAFLVLHAECDSRKTQQWTWVASTLYTGSWVIKNAMNGMCLLALDDNQFYTTNCTFAAQYNNAQWDWKSVGTTLPKGERRCGTNYATASTTCGTACPTGESSVCPAGQSCFGSLPLAPCGATKSCPDNTTPLSTSARALANSHTKRGPRVHHTKDVYEQRRAAADVSGQAACAPGNLDYHQGPVMKTAVIKAIFWGPKWGPEKAEIMDGVDAFLRSFPYSNYASLVEEYTGTGGPACSGATYQGHVIDLSASPPATAMQNITAADPYILAEVCKIIKNPDPSGNGFYPIFTNVKRTTAGFCAWHSSGACNGVPVTYSFHFDMTGDGGCDIGDTFTGHSQPLASAVNTLAHELMETITDPLGTGYWNSCSGDENGDLCAYTFGADYVSFPDGNAWRLQGEWSNRAFTAKTGYLINGKPSGCLSGA